MDNTSRKQIQNPYYLCAGESPSAAIVKRNGAFESFDYEPVERTWAIPFFMQAIDIPVVHRSNYLKGWRYGKNFLWSERHKASGVFSAFMTALVSILVKPLLELKWLVRLVAPMLPQPGQGPSEKSLASGYMKIRYWAKGIGADKQEVIVRGGLTAMGGDVGYKLSSQMVVEAALCNIFDEAKLSQGNYGVITPSVAFGQTLRDRLKKIDIDFYLD